jgi:TPR repeat protein
MWYRQAAEQGDAQAQMNLGLMYAKREGVAQDYVQAHRWLNLAAASGSAPQIRNEAAQARDTLADRMTPAEIARAQALASPSALR